jgi:membrane-associated phospholipid phosphatase
MSGVVRHAFVFSLLILVFAPVGAESGYAQQLERPGPERFLRWSYQDAGALIRDADARLPLYALGSLAILAPATLLDESVSEEVREDYRGGFAHYLNVANELGGPRVLIPVAGIFGASLLTDDQRFQDAAFTSLQSAVYAAAVNFTIKTVAGRARPHQGEGPFKFDPFSGNSSFVSGHTATAFAVLTPWAMYYPGPLTYGLLALGAGGTGVARIARDRHWATDVAAGAAIGFLTAYWLSERHQAEMYRDPVSISAFATPGSISVALRLRM